MDPMKMCSHSGLFMRSAHIPTLRPTIIHVISTHTKKKHALLADRKLSIFQTVNFFALLFLFFLALWLGVHDQFDVLGLAADFGQQRLYALSPVPSKLTNQ